MPKIGEVKRKSNGNFSVYAICKKCGKPRWTTSRKTGRIFFELCVKCTRNPTRKPPGVAAAHQVYCRYRLAAKKRDCAFELNEAEFLKLTKERCYYCGTNPATKYKVSGSPGSFVYNGLDRLDSSKGYTLDNIVPCCFECNKSKGTRSCDEFLNHSVRIAKHQYQKRRLKSKGG